MLPWQPTPMRDAIKKYLQDFGPATPAQIAEDLEIDRSRIYSCMTLTRKQTGTTVFRIASWKREPRHLVPLYEVPTGDAQDDAPRLSPLTGKVRTRKHKSENKARLAAIRRAKSGLMPSPWAGLM